MSDHDDTKYDEKISDFEGTFFKKDGWNKFAFGEVGLLGACKALSKIQYEIENCRRTLTQEKLISKLREIAENINFAATEIERYDQED